MSLPCPSSGCPQDAPPAPGGGVDLQAVPVMSSGVIPGEALEVRPWGRPAPLDLSFLICEMGMVTVPPHRAMLGQHVPRNGRSPVPFPQIQ